MNLDFRRNLGTTDRGLRAGIAFLLVAFAYCKTLTGWVRILATIFAVLLFIDVTFSYCILYDLMGWSTRK